MPATKVTSMTSLSLRFPVSSLHFVIVSGGHVEGGVRGSGDDSTYCPYKVSPECDGATGGTMGTLLLRNLHIASSLACTRNS